MTKSKAKPKPKEVSEQQALAYLKSHPEVVKEHVGLLSELALSHESGGAVSLIERQVRVLRERNILLRRQLSDLLGNARANDDLFAKVRALTLALLEVSGWHELNEVLATHLLVDFDADFACCHLLREHLRLDHVMGHEESLPTAAFTRGPRPLCLPLRRAELRRIFPAGQHEQDGSAVLLPLTLASGDGCLAVGSRDPQRFAAEMDTLFIAYVSDVLARIIDRLD